MRGYRGSLKDRFFAKVILEGPLILSTCCWIWTGYTDRKGYGQMGLGSQSEGTALTHRVSWELHYGKIENNLCVLHKCDNPSCVNPDHLFLGTRIDNNRDMKQKGRNSCGRIGRRSKLTREQVLEIFNSDKTHRVLTSLYGVCSATISEIRSGKIHSKITGKIYDNSNNSN